MVIVPVIAKSDTRICEHRHCLRNANTRHLPNQLKISQDVLDR